MPEETAAPAVRRRHAPLKHRTAYETVREAVDTAAAAADPEEPAAAAESDAHESRAAETAPPAEGGEQKAESRRAHVRDVREIDHHARRIAELEGRREFGGRNRVNTSADRDGQPCSFCC